MTTTTVSMHHKMRTLLNKTGTSENLNKSYLTPLENSTSVSLRNTTSINRSFPRPYNNSKYWNYAIYSSSTYNPYCPDCNTTYATNGSPLVANLYAWYAFLLLLIVAIICIKIGIFCHKKREKLTGAQQGRENWHKLNENLASLIETYNIMANENSHELDNLLRNLAVLN